MQASLPRVERIYLLAIWSGAMNQKKEKTTRINQFALAHQFFRHMQALIVSEARLPLFAKTRCSWRKQAELKKVASTMLGVKCCCCCH